MEAQKTNKKGEHNIKLDYRSAGTYCGANNLSQIVN